MVRDVEEFNLERYEKGIEEEEEGWGKEEEVKRSWE
jgi:hypothetical protein